MAIQVGSLMWLRTTMNYQYRHGYTMMESLKKLYADGGVVRFYRGFFPALLQGPLSRFGDTAANSGIMVLLDNYDTTRNMPVALKTVAASASAAAFRIILTPVDTVKTIMQVEGTKGLGILGGKIRAHGPFALFYGAMATAAATFVGHYPWFGTYNALDVYLPKPNDLKEKLARQAFMGFSASVVSDTISNSLRVIKTYRQTHTERVSYPVAVREILAKDGYAGLFGRGLKTRILTNGLQGLLFSVLWRLIEDALNKRTADAAAAAKKA